MELGSAVHLKPRVLVVDDHDGTREMYAWCMRAAGWTVDEASNGTDALAKAFEFEPDVILIDLLLPGLGGVEVIDRVRSDERTRHIPLVACSGADRRRFEKRVRAAGCDEFVAKPCPPEDMRLLLEALLTRQR
jgi:CheY-like chemotaxis protein